MFYGPSNVQARPEYAAAYPAGPVATSPRMNWSPAVHPAATHWGHYPDFYPTAAGYPPTAGPGEAQRSPSYHISSPNEPSGTPHNIRDILGANAQQGVTLPSEIAKTPSSYQKSPTSTAAGMVFASSASAGDHLRSPTLTPSGTPTQTGPPGRPLEGGVVYSEVPGFYLPAFPRMPGHHGQGQTTACALQV